jgi:Ion transport protein
MLISKLCANTYCTSIELDQFKECHYCMRAQTHTDASVRLACCTLKPQAYNATVQTSTLSPIQAIIRSSNAHAAALVLKNIAIAWHSAPDNSYNSSEQLDCVALHDLIALLVKFPHLAAEYLTQQASLVTVGRPFDTSGGESRHLYDLWVHTACEKWYSDAWRARDQYAYCSPETHVLSRSALSRCAHTQYVKATSVVSKLLSWWKTHSSAAQQQQQQPKHAQVNATLLVVPLPGCHTVHTLQVAVSTADSQLSADIFKSDVLDAVIELHWSMYASSAHVQSLSIYLLLLALFVALTAWFEPLMSAANQELVVFGWVLQCVKCALTLYFVLQEVVEACCIGVKTWLSDTWNVMDIAAYTLVLTAVLLQATADTNRRNPELNSQANVVNSIAAVLLWFKLLHFMRPYKSTGTPCFCSIIARLH